jgi:hypothetical protein
MAYVYQGLPVYKVIVNGVTLTSLVANGITVLAPPTVSTNPAGGSVNDTQTFAMTCSGASLGGDLGYQWTLNGSSISGATSSSYTHPAKAVGSYTYDCIMTNGMGAVTTADAVVTVVASWTDTNTLFCELDSTFNTDNYGYSTVGLSNGTLTPNTLDGDLVTQVNGGWELNGTFKTMWVNINNPAFGGRTLTITTQDGQNITSDPANADAVTTYFQFPAGQPFAQYMKDRVNTSFGIVLKVN